MKRDMDLVRQILINFEGSEKDRSGSSSLSDMDLSKELLDYHFGLMVSGGLLKEHISTPNPSFLARFHSGYSLTWEGHDFLENVRDPEIWQKTKDGAKAAGGFTVEILSDLAKGLVKTQIKKFTGVEI